MLGDVIYLRCNPFYLSVFRNVVCVRICLLGWGLLLIIAIVLNFLPISIVVLRIIRSVVALRMERLAELVVLRILRLERLLILLVVWVIAEAWWLEWRRMPELVCLCWIEHWRTLVSLMVILGMQVVVVLLVLLPTWRRVSHTLVHAWRVGRRPAWSELVLREWRLIELPWRAESWRRWIPELLL